MYKKIKDAILNKTKVDCAQKHKLTEDDILEYRLVTLTGQLAIEATEQKRLAEDSEKRALEKHNSLKKKFYTRLIEEHSMVSSRINIAMHNGEVWAINLNDVTESIIDDIIDNKIKGNQGSAFWNSGRTIRSNI